MGRRTRAGGRGGRRVVWRGRCARWLAPIALIGMLGSGAAHAETAWSSGAPLMLRSGPSTQHRILGSLPPGARVDVLSQEDGWARVRIEGGREGWVAASFLDEQPPPIDRVQVLETEARRLRQELEELRDRAGRLREENQTLSSEDAERRETLEELTQENLRLRAGERWAEWLTGALILGTGMALGALLSRVAGRRGRGRLRF